MWHYWLAFPAIFAASTLAAGLVLSSMPVSALHVPNAPNVTGGGIAYAATPSALPPQAKEVLDIFNNIQKQMTAEELAAALKCSCLSR